MKLTQQDFGSLVAKLKRDLLLFAYVEKMRALAWDFLHCVENYNSIKGQQINKKYFPDVALPLKKKVKTKGFVLCSVVFAICDS